MKNISKFTLTFFFLLLAFLYGRNASAQGLYQTTAKLNVRATMSSKGRIVGSLQKGQEVNVDTIIKSWAQILYNNKKGYVSVTYLKKIEPEIQEVVVEETKVEPKFIPMTSLRDDTEAKLGVYSTPIQNAVTVSKNIKGEKLWNEVLECINQKDVNSIITKCRKIIVTSPLDGTYALNARKALANIFIQTNNYKEIYDSFAYFRYYACYHPEDETAVTLRDRLWERYWDVIDEDAKSGSLDGVWFYPASVMDARCFEYKGCDGLPYLALIINNGNQIRIHPVCELANWAKAYGGSAKNVKNEIGKFTNMLVPSENADYKILAQWGEDNVKKSHSEGAELFLSEAERFRTEGSRIVGEDSNSFGEAMGGTLAVSLVSGIYTGIAELLSTHRETVYGVSLYINTYTASAMDVFVKFKRIKYKNGYITDESNNYCHFKDNLYKMYPHFEFYIECNKGVLSDGIPEGISESDYYKYFHPCCYPQGNKLGLKIKDCKGIKKMSSIFGIYNEDPFYQDAWNRHIQLRYE